LDLPPKRRRLHPVVLDSDQAQGFDHRVERKVLDYRRRAALGEVRRDAEVLAVFTALRQISSSYKLPAAVALLRPLLAAGEPVVVFTAFLASARLLVERLGQGSLLNGAVPVAERQRLVDRFQAGGSDLLVA
ncbi:MAG: ATP-dependent helicase, partial [Cyanobium sp.]